MENRGLPGSVLKDNCLLANKSPSREVCSLGPLLHSTDCYSHWMCQWAQISFITEPSIFVQLNASNNIHGMLTVHGMFFFFTYLSNSNSQQNTIQECTLCSLWGGIIWLQEGSYLISPTQGIQKHPLRTICGWWIIKSCHTSWYLDSSFLPSVGYCHWDLGWY